MACANDTKWVDGDACMIVDSQMGMLSSGVLLPDSRFIGRTISIMSSPSWGMERAMVPRKMPIAVAKNK